MYNPPPPSRRYIIMHVDRFSNKKPNCLFLIAPVVVVVVGKCDDLDTELDTAVMIL